jgi:hypothetical protein
MYSESLRDAEFLYRLIGLNGGDDSIKRVERRASK